jgi:hypothetical protein
MLSFTIGDEDFAFSLFTKKDIINENKQREEKCYI